MTQVSVKKPNTPPTEPKRATADKKSRAKYREEIDLDPVEPADTFFGEGAFVHGIQIEPENIHR